MDHIDVLAQDCSNSIANAMELLQSCAKSSIEPHLNKHTRVLFYTIYSSYDHVHRYQMSLALHAHFVECGIYNMHVGTIPKFSTKHCGFFFS